MPPTQPIHRSFRRPLTQRLASALAFALVLTVQPAPAQLPTLGDGSDMSLAAERKLGDRIAREIYRDPDFVDDPLLGEHVQAIWAPLQAAARVRGELTPEMEERFAWGLMLIRDRSVNAFALPGGYLGVHLGLIGMVATRDELASVLAHELSHVTQRHISRLTSQQDRQTPLVIAAMVLGALAASKSPNAANAMMAGGQALAVQSQLNFSRDMEREADRVGYNVMMQAGFAPQAFVTMFEKLQLSSRLNDNGAYPYLRSHPLTSQRIADMQLRLGSDDAKPVVPTLPPIDGAAVPVLGPAGNAADLDITHGMMAARARILADPGVDGLRSWLQEAALSTPSMLKHQQAKQVSVRYGAVLASMKMRDLPAAQRWLDELTALTRFDKEAGRLSRLLGIELALQQGDVARAASLLDRTAHNRPELLLQAQTALQWQQQVAGSAVSARVSGEAQAWLADTLPKLQAWVHAHPRDAGAWQALARVAQAQHLSLLAIRAEAEVQAANLDLPAAIDRFKAAQDHARKGALGARAGDHIEASIIDSRLRDVEAQLKELVRTQASQR